MHPQIGADILSAVPFPYPVAPLVLAHHERWDGRGYPAGLKGEDIPLGARILCLVDYFDALTSDRPYHKPLPMEAAAELIKQESGKALDPAVVDAFLRILPEVRARVEANLQAGRYRPRILPMSASEGAPISGSPRAAAARPSVFEEISVAHREIYALYELAQTMGTTLGVSETMGHIASKLSRVVPFAACSLFLYTEEDDTVQCRFASGTDAELLQPASPGGWSAIGVRS